MRFAGSFGLCCLLAVTMGAQTGGRTPGFDPQAINRAVNPCENFYQYACGNWIANNPVPADQSRWSRFNELSERNLLMLREILERAAQPRKGRSRIEQQIGDYYASCMDEETIESKGAQPLEPLLGKVRAMKSKQELAGVVAWLHRSGVPSLFGFFASPDYKNSAVVIAQIAQGGLSLPDRDYYLRSDPRSEELKEKYRAHVSAMFRLLGSGEADAEAQARIVVEMETALARASLDRVSRREPEKNYHKKQRAELASLAPALDWNAYFAGLPAPRFDALNVQWPDFLKGLNEAIETRSLEELKVYLTWHILRDAAPLLPRAFVKENFSFFGQALTGARELRPRWKRCVSMVDQQLGEALGQKYVERAFSPESRKRMVRMVKALEKALEKDIQNLDWMTPETKRRAIEKLHAIDNKIGYPDQWRDYSSVKIVRGDAMGNGLRAAEFGVAYRLKKIGTKTDPKEWGMTPPTVNAYYSPLQNNINFPAGILQPPFFDPNIDDAINFGGIGAVIGHELTHGFDDQGRKFDAQGNVADWWTEADAKEFEKRAQCFVEQYSGYTAAGEVKLNGKLTLGENTADNGGLRVAFMALMDLLEGKPQEKIDGYTPAQRLFLGWGQIWCQNTTPEGARLRALTDPHSPGEYRVNGVVSNLPEFREAFGCTAGQPMAREKACRVW